MIGASSSSQNWILLTVNLPVDLGTIATPILDRLFPPFDAMHAVIFQIHRLAQLCKLRNRSFRLCLC